MRKIIEYTLVSADGAIGDAQNWGVGNFQDDAYLRDGLGQLLACDAMLLGRRTYEILANIYSSRTGHPWAARVNAMQKIRSLLDPGQSRLGQLDDCPGRCGCRGHQAQAARRARPSHLGPRSARRDPAEAKPARRARHLDLPDCRRARQAVPPRRPNANLRLITTKSFSKGIVKLTYEPQR